MKIMVWNAARGGMRSVVEAYKADGFLDEEQVTLVHSYADGGFAKRQLVLAQALAKFTGLLFSRHVELVHIHSAMRGSFWRKSLFARLARLRGIPVLFHLHGSEMKVFFDKQSPAIQRVITAELTKADRVLVLSESWRSYIAAIAPNATPVVVPNYVDVPSAVERTGAADTTVLFLGVLGQRKGIFDLLEAFAVALSSRPELRLVVGGNGQVTEAKALADRLGIANRVDFRGWIESDDRRRLLETSDIFVLPSYNEGLPMSVLEAMGHGLPVITTDVGGLPELITNDVDGMIIKPGDRDALAIDLIRLAGDVLLRERLGRAARTRVLLAFSKTVVLTRLRAVYRSVVPPATVKTEHGL